MSPSARSSTSSSSSPRRVTAAERQYNSEMMFIGQRCHWHECNREDFLPFRCPECKNHFCSEHFKSGDHACPFNPQSVVVPLCPLCHEPPKNWRRDEDPNIAMDAHLTPNGKTGKLECPAIDSGGKIVSGNGRPKREKKENECSERRCRKLMIVPIKCQTCSQAFCPSHRAPMQHDCVSFSGRSTKSTERPPVPAPAQASRFSGLLHKANSTDSRSSVPTAANSPHIKVTNPIKAIASASSNHKTEKRANAEHASAIKALKARQAKGILTATEEARLAEEMALAQKKGFGTKSDGDCIIC